MTRLYRQRPATVDAVRWVATNPGELRALVRREHGDGLLLPGESPWSWSRRPQVWCAGQQDWIAVNTGDWVIRHPSGECWPVPDHLFAVTYEPA